MTRIVRKSDGRRIFSDAFKRRQVDRLRGGDLSVAALSRKLGVAPSLLHRWKRLSLDEGAGTDTSVGRTARVSTLRPAQYIRELQLLVGKQTVELELLRAELAVLKGRRRSEQGSPRSR